ncbi:hypothetical protein [Microlunatus speluncae]|uniref:hypothetical protein n=1 Tax=Microlunatus speluncae TaxID=2594267 RepID=UPI0012668261|nr:hypothetical protein [Microlunatus speluncae]
MGIGRKNLGWLLGRLVSDAAAERDEAASVVRDWEPSLDDFERRALIRQLAQLAGVEVDPAARASQLDAIAEISGPGSNTRGDVEPILLLPVDDLAPSERVWLGCIRDDLDEAGKFWIVESSVIKAAVATIQHDLVRTHPDLRWQSAYVWPSCGTTGLLEAEATRDENL